MARISADSLKGKIAELQKKLDKLEKDKGPGIRQVQALMKKLGISVEDLSSAPVAKRGRKPGAKAKAAGSVPIKYKDEQGNTWTGRGRPPKWLAALEAAGRNREEFKIP
ncbi:MAG: hypothetical protein RL026_2508 [Pseudomonadota bacterium]